MPVTRLLDPSATLTSGDPTPPSGTSRRLLLLRVDRVVPADNPPGL